MRIVSWNLQKGYKTTKVIMALLDRWGADIAVFQEPTPGLLANKSVEPGRGGGTRTWFLAAYEKGNVQGHIVAAACGEYKIAKIEGIGMDQVPDNHLVLITFAYGEKGSFTLATCHAPYVGGTYGVASQALENAAKKLEKKELGDRPLIWLGDFNTHGTTKPANAKSYTLRLASLTGMGKEKHPLDKILVLSGVSIGDVSLEDAVCGRILPEKFDDHPMGKGAPQTNVEDLVDPDWDWDASQIGSDHLPIYIDTGLTTLKKPAKRSLDKSEDEGGSAQKEGKKEEDLGKLSLTELKKEYKENRIAWERYYSELDRRLKAKEITPSDFFAAISS